MEYIRQAQARTAISFNVKVKYNDWAQLDTSMKMRKDKGYTNNLCYQRLHTSLNNNATVFVHLGKLDKDGLIY